MQKPLLIKTAIIFGLTLLLLIPLTMIEGLVSERSYRQRATMEEIATSSAGPQRLFGPLLVVPFTEHWTEVTETVKNGQTVKEALPHSESQLIYLLPERLDIGGSLATEIKQRGLFKVRSYVLDGRVEGEFKIPQAYGNPIGAHKGEVVLGLPYVAVTVDDMRGLLATGGLEWGGNHLPFEQGAALSLDQAKGMHATVGPQPVGNGPITVPFAFTLKLRGLEKLDFIPAGKQTHVKLESSWQHPSFHGRFLPDPASQHIGTDGFQAEWSINSLASNVSEDLTRCSDLGCLDAFGVALIDPISIYSLSDRATKYGFLFVGLTFAAILLFELLKGLAIHPAQYTLVGLALAMFFLLLLSLSEHIPFVAAYLIATSACSALIGIYLSAVLASAARGLAAGAMLAGLFGTLYGLLQSEDNALMLGSLFMFGLLAIAMLATRKVDWYRFGQLQAAQG